MKYDLAGMIGEILAAVEAADPEFDSAAVLEAAATAHRRSDAAIATKKPRATIAQETRSRQIRRRSARSA